MYITFVYFWKGKELSTNLPYTVAYKNHEKKQMASGSIAAILRYLLGVNLVISFYEKNT
jgi:hypothetical protein